jgi:hypothetical protein
MRQHCKKGFLLEPIWYNVTDDWYNVTDDTWTITPHMGIPAKTPDRSNKVVVRLLNGAVLKGYTYDFSSLEESFSLLPREEPLQGEPTKVEVKDVKAVFFVVDFDGNPEYHESLISDVPMHGREIEVTFRDGEKIVGRTEGYNPRKLGFFMFPVDLKSNNIRIFVVTRNTRQIRLL